MAKAPQKLTEIFTAMESPEKWKNYKIAQIKIITDKLNIEKLNDFSDYVTKRFIDACNSVFLFNAYYTKFSVTTTILTKHIICIINKTKDLICNRLISKTQW